MVGSQPNGNSQLPVRPKRGMRERLKIWSSKPKAQGIIHPGTPAGSSIQSHANELDRHNENIQNLALAPAPGNALSPTAQPNPASRMRSLNESTKAGHGNLAEEVARPIREVWDEAYEELRSENKQLVAKYEAKMGQFAGINSIAAVGGVGKEELMNGIVEKGLKQYKDGAWKVKAFGDEFLIKDAAKPVVGIIKWADKYVGDALKTNPLASIGWAGVMVFIPLLLNPSSQHEKLLAGLASIADVLVRCTMQENLYFRRWEDNADMNDRKAFEPLHRGYRASLKALYIQVLKFQATTVRYFTKNGGLRILADMAKWHDWETLLDDIKQQDEAMCSAYTRLMDARYEEEFEKLEQRHTEVSNILKSGFLHISDLKMAIEKAQRDSERSALLDWLTSIDPSLEYNKARNMHTEGTGEWLINDNEDFHRWKIAPNSLMWLNGKAGSGKSVLSSSVIRYLQSHKNGNHGAESASSDPLVALAYFYFSYSDTDKQSVTTMLESIIKQICCCRPDTPKSVNALRELKTRGQRPDMATLEAILLEILRGFSDVYIIIDALDECPDTAAHTGRAKLLESLNRFHGRTPKNLHMLWTSRREEDIRTSYFWIKSEFEKWDIDLSTYKPAVDHDIGLFIDISLSGKDYNLWPDELKEEARRELIAKSDGMFQYVTCQFDALRQLKSPKEIRRALHDLPKGLDNTYDRMLTCVTPEHQKQIARVLEWLAFSLRPLLLEEIAEIFILDPEADPPFDDDGRLLDPTAVLDLLPGFITRVPTHTLRSDRDHWARRDTDVVEIRLAHFSIKEYLVSNRLSARSALIFRLDERSAHLHITESCLSYHLQLSQIVVATMGMLRKYQLWEYVVKYWPQHLDRIHPDQTPLAVFNAKVGTRILDIFTRGSPGLLNMRRISDPSDFDHGPNWRIEAETVAPPLYCACGTGSPQLVKLVIDSIGSKNGKCDLTVIDEVSSHAKCGTALQAAAFLGYETMVQLLLDKGADVKAQGGEYGTALQAAARRRNESIVQLLLDKGADINAQGGEYGTALQTAAWYGNESIVQLLLDNGADINAQGGEYGTALQTAAWYGNESIVQLLLDKGADVNAQGGEYGIALQAAAWGRNISMVQLLLDKGADVNAQGVEYGTALQAAAWYGRIEIVQLLLDKGADVNAQGGRFGTALQAACKNGNREIATLLFSAGAKTNPPGMTLHELLD